MTSAGHARIGAPAAASLEGPEGTWPHALSHEPLLRVSDVMALVVSEFPALTPSKLRFLDSNGLVTPHRTGSGYRQYSPADVERLRFVLRQQRDHYRPLSVIAEHLEALDEGRMHEAVAPHLIQESRAFLTLDELADEAGVSVEAAAAVEESGLISQAVPGRYERASAPLVVAAAAYLSAGADVRSLKTLSRAAEREADAATQAARPARAHGDDATADAVARARLDAAIAVFSACAQATFDR